jgi:hypothetical protein
VGSYFSLLLDIRAYVSTCADLITGRPMHPLAAAACLPPEPLPHELVPALADNINQPMSDLECTSHSNSTFFDDNGVLAIHSNIGGTLHNSLVAAFLLFGWSQKDRGSSCLAPDKWERDARPDMLYLGFLICSRSLQITWLFSKRAKLCNAIMQALGMKRPCFKPKVVASIIGKLRVASLIAPWGPYLSFRLAMALNLALQFTYEAIRHWWQQGLVWVSKSMQHNLQIVPTYLQEPEYSPVWSCYIRLIVP